jgi:hypothetical protein
MKEHNGSYLQEVAVIETSTPVGSHTSNGTLGSAVTLTKPAGANVIIIQCTGQNVRYTLDGTTPTTTVGFLLVADQPPVKMPVGGAAVKVIQVSATATIQYQWVS